MFRRFDFPIDITLFSLRRISRVTLWPFSGPGPIFSYVFRFGLARNPVSRCDGNSKGSVTHTRFHCVIDSDITDNADEWWLTFIQRFVDYYSALGSSSNNHLPTEKSERQETQIKYIFLNSHYFHSFIDLLVFTNHHYIYFTYCSLCFQFHCWWITVWNSDLGNELLT